MVCKRVCYKFCPICSPRSRPGRKCVDCDTEASFGMPGDGACYCAKDKKEGIILKYIES